MEQDRRDNPTEWQKRRNDHCLVNYTLILVCSAPSFPSALLLAWNGQWSIALKAVKATRFQMGIVSFTLLSSHCQRNLLSEEARFLQHSASQQALQNTKA